MMMYYSSHMSLFLLPIPNLGSELFLTSPVMATLLRGPKTLSFSLLTRKCSVLIIFVTRDKDWCSKFRLLDERVMSSEYLVKIILRFDV